MTHPPAIFGIGRNYREHAIEMQGTTNDEFIVFMKNPASLIGHNEPILLPRVCQDNPQVDYEGELAILIKDDCKDVIVDDAMNVVKGFGVANDVTARIWQKELNGGQWTRGKSFDSFCPVSDFVDVSEVQQPQNLLIETFLNDQCVQSSNTSQMIFSICEIISELSKDMTILKGTIILTGTPSGVGVANKPPRYLKDGDVVEVTISSVGTLSNQIIQK